MRHGSMRLALGVAGLAALASAQEITNGDFEQNPPALFGWKEVGIVQAGRPGSQGSANSAGVGTPSQGVSLQSGAFRGSAIWQKFQHGAAGSPCYIEFDYRIYERTQTVVAWVEIDGPQGTYGAVLPHGSGVFTTYNVMYPSCGDLELSFNLIETSGSTAAIEGVFQVDSVLATPIGDVPAGAPLAMAPWPPAPPSTPSEQAMAELDSLRAALGLRFTSPPDLESTEGSSKHAHILMYRPWVLWQQIEAGLIGKPANNIRAISFRRDLDTPTSAEFASRTVELEVLLGYADLGAFTADHAVNFMAPPTTVFTKKMVSTPDWTNQPAGPNPAPWDFRLMLDTPWSYDGVNPLLYELDITSVIGLPTSTMGDKYPFDKGDVAGTFQPNVAMSASTGGGCATQNGPFALTAMVENYRTKIALHTTIAGAPSSEAVMCHLGSSNPNLASPQLCSPLLASPDLMLSLGTSGSMGKINQTTFDDLPHSAAVVGMTFYLQAFAFDLGQVPLPTSLSNGIQVQVPADPVFPTTGYTYAWRNTPGGTVATSGPWPGGVVTLMEY